MTDHDDKKPPGGAHQAPQHDKPHQAPGQPHAGLQPSVDRGARPQDDKNHDKNHDKMHDEKLHEGKAAEPRAPSVQPMTTDQAVTPPAGPPHLGGRAMYVLVGPYKGNVLIMPEDEAENAKDNHWAIDQADMEPPFDAANPYEHDHDLTDEDRENAVKEADEWAAKVNAPPEPPPPDGGEEGGEEGAARRRALEPERQPSYTTRATPAPAAPKKK